jgi:hypothetical protein
LDRQIAASFFKGSDGWLPMQIQVDCYAGYRGEETPRFINLADNKIEVTQVLDRWLAPDHRYFKILGDDAATYIIRHDTVSGHWELVIYRAPGIGTSAYGEIGES